MKTNGKARSEAIQEAARCLLLDRRVEVRGQVEILPLARLLAEETGCHLTTAKVHIATAIRRSRGDISAGRNWGGPRPKAIEERKPNNGKIQVRISIEAAVDLQKLMLRHVEGVDTPEEMLEYLIREELKR